MAGEASGFQVVPGRAMITFCIVLAVVMQALDTTIANVALPYIQGSVAASQDQVNWVLTSYIVAAAIMTPPSGWLAGRFGRKRVLMVAIVGFVVASMLCGMAQSLTQIVGFRLMQGAFGAALVPIAQSFLLDLYPPEQHGRAMGLFGMSVMIGPVLGPVLGGWLTENFTWRWVFYINLPIGLVALIGVLIFVHETAKSRQQGLDWTGFISLSIAIGALQLLLDRGEQLNWFGSGEIVLEALVSVSAFYVFLVHVFTTDNPFVPPALFRDRNFAIGTCFIFIIFATYLASMALLTPFLQTLMDYPVTTAGLVMGPRGLGTMISMLIVGRLTGRIDTRLLIASGLLMTAYAMWVMTGWTADIGPWDVVITGFVQGAGLGFLFVPLTTVTFATLPPEQRTHATGFFNLSRNIGGSVGISAVSALLVENTQVNHAEIGAYATPFNHALGAAPLFDPSSAQGLALLNQEITRQATIIAFIDDFWLMMAASLVAVALVLFIRKGKGGGNAEPVAME
ncbi:DHA2 family efflux MFS transporter permease subunit [Methyloligella sp. 2.7D]|uniref:DHA2 family efflux MFS transporter permease subunit n=1 Tax=unclassified Methyloligella TaxID=2625955 RepID=UPI001FF01D73|nr:DHA2 family efflux MFS transporter permease subunit [Methyloligella sp. GL2]